MSPVRDGRQRVFIPPVPLIGDVTSAAQRRDRPDAWVFPAEFRRCAYDVIAARRDVRRYRPDAIPAEVLRRVLAAAHAAPSVGHSQPWCFVIVTDPDMRQRAAWMADQEHVSRPTIRFSAAPFADRGQGARCATGRNSCANFADDQPASPSNYFSTD